MARLDRDAIRECLAQSSAWQIHVADEVSSTNDAVLALLGEQVTEPVVLFAERQTAGRGRRGKAWFGGAPECNLLFSCAVPLGWPAPLWSRLTHVTALALKRAFEAFPQIQPRVKWPNDVYLGDKKVAGILVETEMRAEGKSVAVIGVGINVNVGHDEIPEPLRGLATSLRAETQTWIDREHLAGSILDALNEALKGLEGSFESMLDELRGSHYLLGRAVRAQRGEDSLEGMAIGLGPEGELMLETSEGKLMMLSSADEVRPLNPPGS